VTSTASAAEHDQLHVLASATSHLPILSVTKLTVNICTNTTISEGEKKTELVTTVWDV
jgi:hypothetical protein